MPRKSIESNHAVITDETIYYENNDSAEQNVTDEIIALNQQEEGGVTGCELGQDEIEDDSADISDNNENVVVVLICGSTYRIGKRQFIAGVSTPVAPEMAVRLLNTKLFKKG